MAVLGNAYLIAYIGGLPHLYIWRFGKTAPTPAGPGLGDYTLLPGSDLSATTPYNPAGPPNLHAHNGTLMGTEAALTTASAKITKIYSGVSGGTPSSPLVVLATNPAPPTVAQLKAHFGGIVTVGGTLAAPTVRLGAPPAGGGTPGGGNKVQKVHAGGNAAAAKILAGSVAARKIYAGSTLVWEA